MTGFIQDLCALVSIIIFVTVMVIYIGALT
jgi:hypothetical protein